TPRRRLPVKELVRYLLENLYLDFQGEISLDTVRQFLRGDDSREAKALLQKLIEDKGVDDLLITMADVLEEDIRTGGHEAVVRAQRVMHGERGGSWDSGRGASVFSLPPCLGLAMQASSTTSRPWAGPSAFSDRTSVRGVRCRRMVAFRLRSIGI